MVEVNIKIKGEIINSIRYIFNSFDEELILDIKSE